MDSKKRRVGLFYYTGTGSTAFFSNHIKNKFEELGWGVESHRVIYNSKEIWDDYDLIGIGVPVWYWRAPKIITKRLKTQGFSNKSYFIFLTCESNTGNAQWSIYKTLKNKNNNYLGDIVGNGPNNVRSIRPKLSKPDSIYGNNIRNKDLDVANSNVVDIHNMLLSDDSTLQANPKLKKTISNIKPRKNLWWSFIGIFFTGRRFLKTFVGSKKIDEEKCTKCGLCSTHICPSGAITLSDDKFPIFNEKLCNGCFGCINLCPTLAIYTRYSKNKHPFTTYSKNVIKN